MWWQIFEIILPVLACVLVGVVWKRTGGRYDTEMVSSLVMYVAAPCLVISTLSRVSLPFEQLAHVGAYFAAVFTLTLMSSLLALKLMGQSVRNYLTALVFPNVGNMGLPLCLLAFGEKGLALALGWFMLNSALHFSLGVTLVSGARPGWRWIGNPIVLSVLVAVLMIAADWSLPAVIHSGISMLGSMAIPLMLITLGVSLAGLQVSHLREAFFLSMIRLGTGTSVALLVLGLVPAEPVLAGVVLLQSSMPVAVFNYLFAERYQRSPTQVAGMVVVSTVLSFISLPILLRYALA